MNPKKKTAGQEAFTEKDLQLKIDEYSGMLYKLAFFQLKNFQDAEDVVQETFYQYIRTCPVFESREHEKAWFMKVTLNGCRKLFRCAWYRRRDALPPREIAAEGGNAAESSNATESSVEKEYLARERRQELLDAVFSLPVKYREILHLFYFEDFSVKQIVEVTGRKESTVTSQLTRGRELLRKKLREEYQYD